MNKNLILFLLFFIPALLQGQDNKMNFGFDKDINIYNFNLNGDIKYNTPAGNFIIDQNYRGTSYQTSQDLREEQNLLFKYDLGIYKNFFVTSENKWYLFYNPNSTDKNRLQRLNSTGGIRYLVPGKIMLGVLTGIEQNKQTEISSAGNIFKINGFLQNIDFDNYIINSNLKSEFVSLSDERKNNSFDLNANLSKSFNETDYLTVNGQYNFHDNDILNSVASDIRNTLYNSYAVENIFDKNMNILLNFGFELFHDFSMEMIFNYNDVVIRRDFKSYFSEINNSQVERERNINNINFRLNTQYQTDNFTQIFSAEFSENDEIYDLTKKQELSDPEFEQLQRREKQKDLQSATTRIFSETKFDLTRNDKIGFKYSASIKRDDTPSDLNNDDKDYESWMINLHYEHKFSRILKAGLDFRIDNNHLIYIMSERSNSNYQNRIYTLAPKIEIITKSFSMRPVLQLNANYMVYDYDELTSGVRSFSFRQISYNDSINIDINRRFSLFSRIVLKYYERGKLLWDEFTELPELGSLENFDKLLLFYTGTVADNTYYRIGSGFRYYTLQQQGLLKSNKGNKFNRISYGPETEISFIFSSGTEIKLSGWYEYQFLNGEYLKSVPNLYLETKVNL